MKTAAFVSTTRRPAPFPFTSMFQNGPRRQGSAPENLFKPGKDSPPPRTNRAPLPAPGRSEDLPNEKGKGANAKAKPFRVCGQRSASRWSAPRRLTKLRPHPEITESVRRQLTM